MKKADSSEAVSPLRVVETDELPGVEAPSSLLDLVGRATEEEKFVMM